MGEPSIEPRPSPDPSDDAVEMVVGDGYEWAVDGAHAQTEIGGVRRALGFAGERARRGVSAAVPVIGRGARRAAIHGAGGVRWLGRRLDPTDDAASLEPSRVPTNRHADGAPVPTAASLTGGSTAAGWVDALATTIPRWRRHHRQRMRMYVRRIRTWAGIAPPDAPTDPEASDGA